VPTRVEAHHVEAEEPHLVHVLRVSERIKRGPGHEHDGALARVSREDVEVELLATALDRVLLDLVAQSRQAHPLEERIEIAVDLGGRRKRPGAVVVQVSLVPGRARGGASQDCQQRTLLHPAPSRSWIQHYRTDVILLAVASLSQKAP